MAAGDEALDVFDEPNAASSPESGAIESGGGAGEFELARDRPAPEEAVDKSGVEDIAGASGVAGLDSKGGGVVKLHAVPAKDAFLPKSGGRQGALEAVADGRERFFQIVLTCEAARNVPAGDEVIDVFEE